VKVTAVVVGGTHQASSSSFELRPAIGEDGDIEWSPKLSETYVAKQSYLASLLSFPDDKGSDRRFWGWALTLLSVGAGLMAIYQLVNLSSDSHEADPRDADWMSNSQIILFLSILGLIIGWAILASGFSSRKQGRDEALAIWNRLYYCIRDDIVYDPGMPGNCVPPGAMRTILRY
jgi:hypothetical protein